MLVNFGITINSNVPNIVPWLNYLFSKINLLKASTNVSKGIIIFFVFRAYYKQLTSSILFAFMSHILYWGDFKISWIKSLEQYLIHMIGDSKFCQHLLNKTYLYLLFASCTVIRMASKILCIKNCKKYKKSLNARNKRKHTNVLFNDFKRPPNLLQPWFLTIFLEIIHCLFLAICASVMK